LVTDPHFATNSSSLIAGHLSLNDGPRFNPQVAITAAHLLEKARMIIDNDIEDAAVHIWNKGTNSEKLYVGLMTARNGSRRTKKSK